MSNSVLIISLASVLTASLVLIVLAKTLQARKSNQITLTVSATTKPSCENDGCCRGKSETMVIHALVPVEETPVIDLTPQFLIDEVDQEDPTLEKPVFAGPCLTVVERTLDPIVEPAAPEVAAFLDQKSDQPSPNVVAEYSSWSNSDSPEVFCDYCAGSDVSSSDDGGSTYESSSDTSSYESSSCESSSDCGGCD